MICAVHCVCTPVSPGIDSKIPVTMFRINATENSWMVNINHISLVLLRIKDIKRIKLMQYALLIRFTDVFYFVCSYDGEGRLTNVSYPTGMVTSLHREMEQSINIDMESSNRDDDVTIVTNLSSVEASYTVLQGKKSVELYMTSQYMKTYTHNATD